MILSVVLAGGAVAGVSAASGTPQFLVETDAGGELVPASRLSVDDPPPSTSTTTTTTTTTTVPAGDGLQPPPLGRIAFPIDAVRGCSASDNFGDPRGNRRHEGLDIVGSPGRAVYAVVSGLLVQRYDEQFLSNGFPRTSGAGIGWKLYDAENDVVYKFFHLQRHEDGLEVGDRVSFGDVIGYVGNTGTSGVRTPSAPDQDTNYHLHFEYRPNNIARDPRPLLVPHPNCPFF